MENVKKRRGERKMRLQDKLVSYLEYCTYRKELDQKTVKAYRIDLNQYFTFVACEEPDKEKIEEYITELHKKYKQKTVKRKIAANYAQTECQFRYCGTAIPFLTVRSTAR